MHVQQLDRYFDSSDQGVAFIHPDSTVLYANKPFVRLLKGYHLHTNWNLLFQEDFRAQLQQSQSQDQMLSLELPELGYRLEFRPAEIETETGLKQLVCCTALKSADSAEPAAQNPSGQGATPPPPSKLEAAYEVEFKRVMNQFPHNAWLCGLNGEVFWTNRSSNLFSYDTEEFDDLSNSVYVHKIHPDDLQHTSASFSTAMVSGSLTPFLYRLRHHTGRYEWFLFSSCAIHDAQGQVKYWAGSSVNVNNMVEELQRLKDEVTQLHAQKERLQSELQKAQSIIVGLQKIDIVGHLAGGIAHDLNNLLFVMNLNLGSLQKKLQDPVMLENIQAVLQSVQRAARLSSQLAGFSGRMPQNATTFCPISATQDIQELLSQAVGAEVDFSLDIATDLHCIRVDKTYLENALINLVINARDATDGHGKVSVRIFNDTLEDGETARDYVVFCVSDNGNGISPEMQERIFEPFFTTKEAGKGTGLGLPMVKTFVENSQGILQLNSAPGEGCEVRIYLPRSLADIDTTVTTEANLVGGRETVLLIEDDEAVRKSISLFLRDLGYDIITSFNHEHAITLVAGGLKPDLILSDIRMPGNMTVMDLIEHVERYIRTPIIFATGYSAEISIRNGLIADKYPVLFKPFGIEELALKMREVLDSQAHSPSD